LATESDLRREVLDQVLERLVGQALTVGPGGVAEDAGKQIRVGGFQLAQRGLDGQPTFFGFLADIVPVRAFGNLEAVILGELGVGEIASGIGQGVTPKQIEQLNKIDTAAQHLLAIINDILDLSKIEAGKFVLDKVPVRANAILTNVSSILAERTKEKYLELLIDIEPSIPELFGDVERFRGARILVVDDEPMNREVAQMLLEEAELVVDTAANGQEAITMASATSYAAIFMDMQMLNVHRETALSTQTRRSAMADAMRSEINNPFDRYRPTVLPQRYAP
jgi:hypothetical protein